MTNAITINDVSKRFRVYKDRNQSLKGAFLQRRRAQYEDLLSISLPVKLSACWDITAQVNPPCLNVLPRFLPPTLALLVPLAVWPPCWK